MKAGLWKEVKNAFPEGIRLGATSKKSVEMLIPTTLPGLEAGTKLKVALGYARRG